jgi:predicted MFS family arabinose efflux permease
MAIGGFAVVNTITAVSSNYALTLGARFFAGVFAGLLWAMLAGYASRMVPEQLRGRAIAVAMVGTPLALSLGVPAGTFLGASVGWRYTFGIMSVLTIVLTGWVLWKVPDFPGQSSERRLPLRKVLAIPGLRSVLFVTCAFVLAHNVLYTYIAPVLVPAGMAESIDVVLLVFGVSSLAGIWFIAAMIDRWLRELVLVSTAGFAMAALALGLCGSNPAVICVAITVWGLTFGGAATLFQTASAKTAGEAADVAQSMIVTVWNLAIAGGGIVGGALLETLGVHALPWTTCGVLLATFIVAGQATRHGFPRL